MRGEAFVAKIMYLAPRRFIIPAGRDQELPLEEVQTAETGAV